VESKLKRLALFLDRDGVINVDHAYVYKNENFEFIEGIFDLCRTAKELGFLIIVITNQAGIGRGYYTEQDFHDLTKWMTGEFSKQGVDIDKVYFCPFHPEHGVGKYKLESPRRKPNPGMILQAAEEFEIDLANSVVLGDKESDIQAGIAAGVGCNVLFCPSGKEPPQCTEASQVIRSLSEVVSVLSRCHAASNKQVVT
jgi:D-glycero-D-manno-heptose 1,7-bisphosphate phosphatase